MTSNYSSIRTENEQRYGTDIGRIGKRLLADLYADRTHFIFEILQNAEDAMDRRGGLQKSRSVQFTLSKQTLRVSHFGKPFDELDVRAICNIAETTKSLTDIGRFGIGFKSVYAFTDMPEVHSGEEDFAIENYVLPTPARPTDRQPDETVFLLPLRPQDTTAFDEITKGLRKLGPQTLLFLRHIDEIAWSVEGGPSGMYLRSKPETIGRNLRRITVIGQEEGRPDIEEMWLVFSRTAKTDGCAIVGQVEIAFSTVEEKESRQQSVQAVSDSPLVVFFPTVLETHLGFLVQGPYSTTPSRDNVPRSDPWNQRLVRETATLLVEALRSLRDLGLLNASALISLPLDRTRFGEGYMFAALFDAVRDALSSEPLLPRFGGGHVSGKNTRLARTQELRELVSAAQLGALLGEGTEISWLSEEITQDRSPDLRQYLMRELDIGEVTPESVLPKLNKTFLETQSDEWICRLYEFLNGQPSLRWRLNDLPLIRLEDGTHVTPDSNGQPQAFLPSEVTTDFPTVRRTVCATEEARKFLQSLGVAEPDPVDDVVRNVLPRYQAEDARVADADYEADIRRVLKAFGTDSKNRREKLLTTLRDSFFIRAVDAGSGAKRWAKPDGVYLATERLKGLFAGIPAVILVDDSYACLKGEDVRAVLDACGAVRHLRPVPDNSLTRNERMNLRKQAGHEETSRQNDRVEDWMLVGIDGLLTILPQFDSDERGKKANLLWDELAHLEERRGKSVFEGVYTWTHYGHYEKTFPSAFVRQLNETTWVPDANGELQRPAFVIFDTLGWKHNPFLLSKIRFKPPIIDTLAKEAGIEPGVLDLLKKYGLTSEAELKARLGIKDEAPETEGERTVPSEGDRKKTSSCSSVGENGGSREGGSTATGGTQGGAPDKTIRDSRGGSPGAAGDRQFISYVAVRPYEEETDPDGIDQQARMDVEEKAIQLILQREPQLHRTPSHNPGYDLFETGDDEKTIRWVEVKAMARSLSDRPVGLSHTQFECAREHGEAYWLYVVEHAGSPQDARIVRIQDPAGKARTFTFDHGWLSVAQIDDKNNDLR